MKTSNTKVNIAIIGAGTAGLATALFLSKQDHQIDLYEEVENPEPVGAGLLIQPQGLFVLNELGLMNDVINKGAKVEALIGKNNKSKAVMDFKYTDLHPDLFGVGIHRGGLFESLFKPIKESNVNLLLGQKVIDLKQVDESAIVVTESSEKQYDLVVIANGTWSDLSRNLDIKKTFKPYPWGALWKIFDDEDGQFQTILDQKYIKAHSMLGMLPTGRNPNTYKPCVSFFYSLKKDQYKHWLNQDINHWKDQVLKIWPELDTQINTITSHNDLTFATYADHVMKQWHDRRVVIIGDAAHAMSPQLGQGANMALTDAYYLDQALRQETPVQEALQIYSASRKKHLKYYQWASRFLTPLFQSNSWFGATFRDLTFPPMKYIPMAKKHALLTLFGVKPSFLGSKPMIDLETLAFDICQISIIKNESDFLLWLDQQLQETIPKDIIAFSINIYESPFKIEIVGSKEFDPDDEDWACNEDWIPKQRTISVANELFGNSWEEAENQLKQFSKIYLESNMYNTKKLVSAKAIAIGFVDGNLNLISR